MAGPWEAYTPPPDADSPPWEGYGGTTTPPKSAWEEIKTGVSRFAPAAEQAGAATSAGVQEAAGRAVDPATQAVLAHAKSGLDANQLQPEQHNIITNALAKAPEAIGGYLPMAAAQFGGEAAGGAAGSVVPGAGTVVGGVVGGAAGMGSQQYAQTYHEALEEAKAAKLDPDAQVTYAKDAATRSGALGSAFGAIPLAGGAARAGAGLLGLGARTAAEAGGKMVATKFLPEAAKGAAATVAGVTGYGAASGYEQNEAKQTAGLPSTSPLEAAATGAIGGAEGSVGFLPLALLHARVGPARAKAVADALADPKSPNRVAAVRAVYDAMEKADPVGANMWSMNAGEAMNAGKPIGVDSSWTENPHPSVFEGMPALPAPGKSGASIQMGDNSGQPPPAGPSAAEVANNDLHARRAAVEQQRLEASGPLGRAASAGMDSGAVDQKQAERQTELPEAGETAKPAAKSEDPAQAQAEQNIASWTRNRPGMPLEQAQEAASTATSADQTYSVIPHPLGGFDAIPDHFITPEIKDQNAGLQSRSPEPTPVDNHPYDADAAQARAAELTAQSGREHEAVPHPFMREKFAVQEKQPFTEREQQPGDEHAVQEPGAGGVLQREPGQAGEPGGERGRVEQGIEGEGAAGEGQAAGKENGPEARVQQGVAPRHADMFPEPPESAAKRWGWRAAQPEEAVGISKALQQSEGDSGKVRPLFRGATSIHIFDSDNPESPQAVFDPNTGAISVRSDIARQANDGGAAALNTIGHLVHEGGHALDRIPGTPNFYSSDHPSFALGGAHDTGSGRTGVGDIAKEVIDAYNGGAMGTVAAMDYPLRHLSFSPKDLKVGDERAAQRYIKNETFAQLVAFHEEHPYIMRQELPKAFDFIERMQNAIEHSTEGSVDKAVRESFRALESGVDAEHRSERGGPTDAGGPGSRDASAGVAGRAAVEHPSATDRGGEHVVNIGLNTNDGKGITKEEAIKALEATGAKVTRQEVRQSDTEQTLVASLDRPLTPDEAHRVSVDTRQEAIAQKSNGVGELYGPGADNWKPYNDDFFMGHTPSGSLDVPDHSWQAGHEPEKPLASKRDESAIKFRDGAIPRGLPKNPGVADLAKYLNDKVAAQNGGKARDYNNPRDVAAARKQMLAEVKYQLSQPRSGLGWYVGDVKKAWRWAAQEHPDLAKDPVKRQLSAIVTAIMSPGTMARINFRDGLENWDHYEKNGRFSERRPDSGKAWGVSLAREQAIGHINAMLADPARGGESGVVAWLLTEHPKSMLDAEKARYGLFVRKGKEGVEGLKANADVIGGASSMHLGAEMFGEKVGPFAASMNGMTTGIAVDVWATRTVRRLFGTLPTVTEKSKVVGEQPTTRERMLATEMMYAAAHDPEIKRLGVANGPDAQGVQWFFEQQLYHKLGLNTESGFFSDGAKEYVESRGHEVSEQGSSLAEATIPKRASEAEANAQLRGDTFEQHFSSGAINDRGDGGVLFSKRDDGSINTRDDNFKKWFGKSRVVDGKGQAKPLYHGTLKEFAAFSPDDRGKNSFGGGIYMTDSPADASYNYAHIKGPDNEYKLNERAQQILDQKYDESRPEPSYGTAQYKRDMNAARRQAVKEMADHQGVVMPLYAKIEKPFEIFPRSKGKSGTFLDYEMEVDHNGDFFGGEKGELVDFINSLSRIAEDHGRNVNDAVDSIKESAQDDGGIYASQLIRHLEQLYGFEDDNGESVTVGTIISRTLQNMDRPFDGIIDHAVYEKWGGMGSINRDTTHYIAFEPTQVKSSVGNSGEFDASKPDVLASRRQTETPEFKKWFGTSKVVGAAGEPARVYHGTQNDIGEFYGREMAGWFSEEPRIANDRYAGQGTPEADDVGPSVYSTYLSIKNPLDLVGKLDMDDTMDGRSVFKAAGLPFDDTAKAYFDKAGVPAHEIVNRVEFVAAAKHAGFDGIKVTEDGATTWGAFDPVQIKSATGNSGAFDAKSADIRASKRDETKPTFYSGLAKAVTEKAPFAKDGTVDAQMLRNWLDQRSKDGTVKRDEIAWTGLDDYLKLVGEGPARETARAAGSNESRALGIARYEREIPLAKMHVKRYKADGDAAKAAVATKSLKAYQSSLDKLKAEAADTPADVGTKISRDEVQKFLDTNGVRVEEKMLGNGGNKPKIETAQIHNDPDGYNWAAYVNGVDEARFKSDAEARAWAAKWRNKGEPAKYADRVLPGGKNYRELLMTLPKKNDLNEKQGFRVYDKSGKMQVDTIYRAAAYKELAANPGGRVETYNRNVKDMRVNFNDPHWPNTPNVVGHLRFNERTDANGKRVMFLEEVQGGWGQTGRKEGFNTPAKIVETASGWSVELPDGGRAYFDNKADAESRVEKLSVGRTIPNAPFVGKTEAWVALLLKRAIRYAAENGFDRVAWTTGEQQAARGGLSQDVKELQVLGHSDGEYTLRAYDKDDNMRNVTVPDAKLAEHVGKDLAAKIEAQKSATGTYKGLDLQLGGEGMKAFYDKIVPNVANDVLKKLGGGKVDEAMMHDNGSRVLKSGDKWKVIDHNDNVVATLDTADQARTVSVGLGRGIKVDNPSVIGKQQGFDITPNMKSVAMGGQLLFSRRGGLDYSLYSGVDKPDIPKKPLIDSLRKLLMPASRGPIASLQAGIMRENLARLARDGEIANDEFKTYAKLFSKMPQELQIKFVNNYERGITEQDPALRQVASAMKAFNADLRTQIQGLGTGKLETFQDTYLGRIWKDDDSKVNGVFARRPLEGSKGFLKRRVYEYFSQGIEAGLIPLTYNPIEMMLLKGVEQRKFITGQRIFAEMKAAQLPGGLGPMTRLVPPETKPPAGWVAINDKIALAGSAGKYYAPDEAATLINNHLSPGLRGNGVYDYIHTSGMLLNSMQLGLSAFHVGFTTLDSMVSKAALGAQQISRGQFLDGIGSLAQSVNPAYPFINFYRGDKLLRGLMGKLDDPSMAPIIEAVMHGGGRFRMDEFYRNATLNGFKQAIRDKNKFGILKSAIPTLMDRINAPVFEQLVPRQKLGVFFDMAQDWIKRNPDATLAQKREAMGKYWDSVDNRMGQLAYDNVFWNRTLKDALMISVRSVGWNLGTFRELGGGVADFKDILKNKELSTRAGYVLALPFVTAIMGSIIGYLYTGKGPDELKDYFFPKTGKIRPDRTEDRLSLPSYMKDIFEYYHDASGFAKYGANPTQTLQNKMHPLLGVVAQMLSNKDFFGGAIRSPGDPLVQQAQDFAGYIGKQIAPFSVRNFEQQQKTKGQSGFDPLGYVTSPSMIGVTPSPGYITKTDKQEEASALGAQKDALISKFRQELQDGANPSEMTRRMFSAGLRLPEVSMVMRQGMAQTKISKLPPRQLRPQLASQ